MDQYKLEKFNSNIIKWYPFEENKTILQIGENNYITQELEKKFINIKTIKNIEEIEQNKKYDYILIYGYEKYDNIIEKITPILNNKGKILIIGNNEIGINNWSKYDIDRQKGVLKLENNPNIKTIKNVKRELQNNQFTENNIFYVFPDYKTAELIINKNLQINKGNIEKYNPNILEEEIKVFNEIDVLKTIVSNSPEMLEIFANSYFIEASKSENKNDIKYASFNNCRKEQYQLITLIKENIVEKLPANEKAKEHLTNMASIIENVKNENIQILDYEKEGKIYSKLIKEQVTLDEILYVNSNNIDSIISILNDFKNVLLKNALDYKSCKGKITFRTDKEMMEQLHYLKNGYWDMIAKNCFYINNEFIFFDQEWEKPYLPVEFIIYRSIINSYNLVKKINVDELLEKLNILKYKNFFNEIDQKLRDEILDQEIYEAMYKKDNLKAIDNLINENKSYLKELENKDNYIKQLEQYYRDLKEDNEKKQQYINNLEKITKNSRH
mgnify:CR=1 FL=1